MLNARFWPFSQSPPNRPADPGLAQRPRGNGDRMRPNSSGWLMRRWQREELRELSDHILADIGVTREQVIEEIKKPFWR